MNARPANTSSMNGRPEPHLAILGTSRSGRDTHQVLTELVQDRPVDVVDLNDLTIAPYHYEHAYSADDDFAALAQRMAEAHSLLLATPVYWYTMSAQMKVMVDRLSDLITIAKPLGRALAGKRLSFLAVGTQPQLAQGFADPFWQTAAYFDMHYEPGLYVQSAEPFLLSREARASMTAFATRFWTALEPSPRHCLRTCRTAGLFLDATIR